MDNHKNLQYHIDPSIVSYNRLTNCINLSFHKYSNKQIDKELHIRSIIGQAHLSSNVLSLNGLWKFKLFRCFEHAIEFLNNNANNNNIYEKNDLASINVPGNWQLQAVNDIPIYTNIKYIIPINPPNVPIDHNPTGYYQKCITISTLQYRDNNIILSFGGVDSAFYLFINHKFVGFSTDSRLSADFDITTFINNPDTSTTSNNNITFLVEAIVLRYSHGFYLEDQDMFNLSGIFRDVLLYNIPKDMYISDYNWHTIIKNTKYSSEVHVEVEVSIHCTYLQQYCNKRYTMNFKLFEDGLLENILYHSSPNTTTHKSDHIQMEFSNSHSESLVSEVQIQVIPTNIDDLLTQYVDGMDSFEYMKYKLNAVIEVPTEKCQLWSAERPYLYTLMISLIADEEVHSSEDNVIQQEACRIGFRSVHISTDGILRVNQQPVTIRGVNLHEHDPVYGHKISPQLLEADIVIMKRHNFNAIRTCHYPQTPWFYELCTAYGMYVIDECNIETHGMQPYVGRLADDILWDDAYLSRVRRMYERDKRHTCIIGWSLGNESGYGVVHDKMAAWIRSQDNSRILMYEPASYGPRDDCDVSGSKPPLITNREALTATDVICPMYARVEECIELSNLFTHKPVIQCEYAHMMGNSGGNFNKYWDLYYSETYPRIQGGFIWDWVDQGLLVADAHGKGKWAYGGDFGELSHDSNFCINGLIWPDRGIQLDSLYESSPPSEQSTSHKLLKYSPQSNMSSVIDYHLYGLSSNSKLEYSRNLSSKNDRIHCRLFKALSSSFTAKPVLLEAKQSMRCFRTELKAIHTTQLVNNSNINSKTTNNIEGQQSDFEKCTLKIDIELLITNLFNHTEDIFTTLTFQVLLQCEGMIIAEGVVIIPSNLDDDNNDFTNKRIQHISFQSLLPYFVIQHNNDVSIMKSMLSKDKYCGLDFDTNIFGKCHDERIPIVTGIACPENLLNNELNLSHISTLLSENQSFKSTCSPYWMNLNQQSNNWSLIVIGKTCEETPWANKNYPMGFCQINLPKENVISQQFHKNKLYSQISPNIMKKAMNEAVKVNQNTSVKFINSNIQLESGNFKVVINGKSGMPEVMQQVDFNYLYTNAAMRQNNHEITNVSINCTTSVDDMTTLPTTATTTANVVNQTNDCVMTIMSMQLYRAPTDNDRVGYTNIWEAVGLDHCMHLVPIATSHKYHSNDASNRGDAVLVSKELEEFQEDINYLPSEYLLVHRSTTMATSNNNNNINNNNNMTNVNCSWSMQPYKPINKMKIRILLIFNLFLCNENENIREVYIPFNTSEEEAFIHFLGMTYRLGRKSNHADSVSRSSDPDLTSTTALTRGTKLVRVWKAWLYVNCTTRSAEFLIGGGFNVGFTTQQDNSTQEILFSFVDIFQCYNSKLIHDKNKLWEQFLVLNNQLINNEEDVGAAVDWMPQIHFACTYSLSAEGVLGMEVSVDVSELIHIIPSLPRIGLQLLLDDSITSKVSWFGKGPHECYIDRQESGINAIHECSPLYDTTFITSSSYNNNNNITSTDDVKRSKLHVPYIRPGENGARANTTWVQFVTKESSSTRMNENEITIQQQSHCLRITNSSKNKCDTMHFSAQPYTTHDLQASMHIHDVLSFPRPYTVVNIDPYLMGVGGDDSWSACVHKEYLLSPNHMIYDYSLKFTMS